jgi:hypothetical protein
MLGQIGYAITAYAFYVASKEGATGLTGTVTVRDESNTKIVDGSSFTEVGEGWYEYTLVAGSVDAAGDYKFTFHTTSDTVDQKDIPALWIVGRTWVENIDQAITTTESNIQGADSDTLETLSDQLDSVTATTGGANDITITVNDGTSVVSTVRVEIRDSGGNYKTHGYTNGSGVYSGSKLDDGTYNVYLHKDGYTNNNPYTLTVSGDTSSTFSITAVSVDPPSDPDLCRVYLYLSTQKTGTAPSSVESWLEIVSLPYYYGGEFHTGDRASGTYNSDTRLLYWDVVIGAKIRAYVKNAYENQSAKTVPNQSTVDLNEMT